MSFVSRELALSLVNELKTKNYMKADFLKRWLDRKNEISIKNKHFKKIKSLCKRFCLYFSYCCCNREQTKKYEQVFVFDRKTAWSNNLRVKMYKNSNKSYIFHLYHHFLHVLQQARSHSLRFSLTHSQPFSKYVYGPPHSHVARTTSHFSLKLNQVHKNNKNIISLAQLQ